MRKSQPKGTRVRKSVVSNWAQTKGGTLEREIRGGNLKCVKEDELKTSGLDRIIEA